jgi:dihydropteroate synthase
MLLKLGPFDYTFPRPSLVMGILNITPDSFSDGGQFLDSEAAVARAVEMEGEGADWIDVGGESTRPRATPVSLEEELRRVMPVLEGLKQRVKTPISIDTMKPEVARRAVQAGACLINDISAGGNERMWEVAAETGAGYVAMHMQGRPQNMQENPSYHDVVAEVFDFFVGLLERLERSGVKREQIIVDVGIGFGKKVEHNLELLRALKSFTKLGRPLLLGVSRKSFIGKITGAPGEERLSGSLACAVWGVEQGAHIIRAHDVAQTKRALRVTDLLAKGQTECFSKP